MLTFGIVNRMFNSIQYSFISEDMQERTQLTQPQLGVTRNVMDEYHISIQILGLLGKNIHKFAINSNDSITLTVFNIYRPPTSSNYSQKPSVFLDEFASLLSLAATTPNEF